MNEVKLLHIADVHLGRKISHLSDKKSQIRKSEINLTLAEILDRFTDAQIVLISGDLFDGDCADSTITYVCNLFERHMDKNFFVSCGNHDCINNTSIRKFTECMPENAFVFGDTIECIEMDDIRTRIYGISFSAPNSYASLINGFVAIEDEYINLMTIHADVGKDSPYNPISFEDIENSKLSYLALGHVHGYSGIKKRGKTYFAYPGVPEPAGFDETGECGVIYGTISKDDCSLEFYPTSKRKYITLDFDVSNFSSNEDVVTSLKTLVNERDLFRVNFIGRKRCQLFMDTYEDLLDAFYFDYSDSTRTSDTILNYSEEVSLRGKTVKHLNENKFLYDDEVFAAACDILTEMMCRD